MARLRTEQAAAERRAAILDAAAVVFAARGFHATTIHDVAVQAGLADGTLYNYFENKTALLFALLERMQQQVIAQAEVPPADASFPTFLATFLRQPLRALEGEQFALFRVVMSECLVNEALRRQFVDTMIVPITEMARAQLNEWVAEGRLPPTDVPRLVDMLYRVVLGLLLGAALQPAPAGELERLSAFIADIVATGTNAS